MTRAQYEKQQQLQKQRNLKAKDQRRRAYNGRHLRRQFKTKLIILILIVFCIMFNAVRCAIEDQTPGIIAETTEPAVTESPVYTPTPTQPIVPDETYPTTTYSRSISGWENYLLARIVMAEAEGESMKCKEAIVMVILNRVSDDYFPDTIEEVIFQKSSSGVYQFTPIANGRWDRVEPNKECFEAVDNVMKQVYDNSMGATYFEACSDSDNWHSRNLEFLFEIDGTRFYK